MESIPRPHRYVLRSYYDIQVLTASVQFLGRSDNVAEYNGGLNDVHLSFFVAVSKFMAK